MQSQSDFVPLATEKKTTNPLFLTQNKTEKLRSNSEPALTDDQKNYKQSQDFEKEDFGGKKNKKIVSCRYQIKESLKESNTRLLMTKCRTKSRDTSLSGKYDLPEQRNIRKI